MRRVAAGTASYYTDAQNVDEELRRTGSLHVYGEGFAPAGVTGTDASGGHSLASTSSQQESVSVSSRSASGDHNVNGGQPGQEVDTTFQHALSRLSDDVKDNFDSQSNTSLSAAGPKRYNTLYPGPQHVPGKLDAHSVRSVGSVVATAQYDPPLSYSLPRHTVPTQACPLRVSASLNWPSRESQAP